jgi:hypothetical protein
MSQSATTIVAAALIGGLVALSNQSLDADPWAGFTESLDWERRRVRAGRQERDAALSSADDTALRDAATGRTHNHPAPKRLKTGRSVH